MASYGTTRNSRRGRGTRKNSDNGDGWAEWGGYMAAKRMKLYDQFDKSMGVNDNELGHSNNFFKGVAIHVDGYTKPSSDELKRLIRQHGGRYEHYMMKTHVTHVIATSLPDSKIRKDFKNCKVVKPEWITECVKAGRLLSYVPYQLFTCQSKNQQGMTSYSTFAVTRQTNTASTLLRMASTNKNYGKDDSSSIQNGIDVTEENMNQTNICDIEDSSAPQSPDNLDIDDSDSSDNEFGRLIAESKPSGRKINTVNDKSGMDKINNFESDTYHEISIEDFYSNDKSLNVNNGTMNDQIATCSEIQEAVMETCQSGVTEGIVTKHPDVQVAVMGTCHSGVTEGIETKQTKPIANRGMAVAGEPEFISEFYNNSRLHHLSAWKSEFKSYVNELQKRGTDFAGRQRLREFVQQKCEGISDRGIQHVKIVGKPEKVIMHIDMDCFFVSVGLRKRPELRGKPIAVTHSKGKGVSSPVPGSDPQYEFEQWRKRKLKKGTGDQKQSNQMTNDETLNDSWNVVSKTTETFHSMSEIASCNYEARKAGLKNGMFMGKAKSLCPELVTIPYDFEGYNEVSKLLYNIMASYTHDIEAVSCDEMLIDCTDILSDTGAEPLDLASLLRQEIYQKTKCHASVGLGSNILQAKMATRKAKPNGQYHLQLRDVIDFMKEQSVKDIPGVGWSMSRRLQSMSVSTCGDLQNLSLGALQKEFGPKTGQSLYKYCRGQDDRQIKLEQERKSVSAEINYGIRFKNEYDADKFLAELSDEVHNRLKKISMKGKTVTLKLMIRREDAPKETAKFMGHGLCNHISKSSTLPLATDDPKIIAKECLTILKHQHLNVLDLRGVGIQIQRLEPAVVGSKTAKGPASILNFTVTKQDITKATEKKNCAVSSHVVQSNTRSVQSVEAIPQDKEKSCENMLNNFLTHNKKPASLPTTSESGNKDEDIIWTNSEIVLENAGNDYQKNKTCSDKTQDLVEDMMRRKNILVMPPLPSLNIETSPVSTGNTQLPSLNLETTPPGVPVTPESTRNRTDIPTDYFPSPSQIDPDVLNELPADIRRQITNEMETRKKKSNKTCIGSGNPASTASSDNPGCSHWSSQQNIQPIIDQNQVDDSRSIVPLPSLSQLDESCFNALPEEIQREIKNAYAHQDSEGGTEKQKSPINKKTHDYVKLTSPAKNKSPGRGKKNSPTFKVPKGRPGKGKPKKLEFVSKKQPKIDVVVSGKKNTEVQSTNIITISDEVIDVEPSSTVKGPVNSSNIVQEPVKSSHIIPGTVKTSVNLCGAVTIIEIRELLKEWLHTSNDPEKDDEDVMTDYLTSLVLDHNLEQVDLVIKFLNRHIRRMDSSTWMLALDRILESVQKVMNGVYGSRLKL